MSGRRHTVAIIGSGPAAYTAAIYTGRADLRPVIFEGSSASGGALMTTTEVENFPGFPEAVLGPNLISAMRRQAERFGAEFIRQDVTSVDLTGPVKTIVIESGETIEAESVIAATGSKYRALGLADELPLTGNGLSWCATCDGPFFRDQDIAVVGGGDSALEEALCLSRFVSSVKIIHRRAALRASQIMQTRARSNPKISFLWNSEVAALVGSKKLSAVHVRDVVTGQISELTIQGLFVAIGHEPRSDLFRGQLELDAGGYVVVQTPTTKTNLPGVFACGDLVDRHYRQAITAAGSGCAAALDAERFCAEEGVSRPASFQTLSVYSTPQTVNQRAPVAKQGEAKMPARKTAVHLTDETFSNIVIESPLPVLVDFWADWCGPCMLMSPVIDEIAHEYADRMVVAKLDIDECPKSAEEYEIKSTPVLKLFINGQVAHTIVGAKPKGTLMKDIKNFLP
jgi:thioredoxin reductase (NADPH)